MSKRKRSKSDAPENENAPADDESASASAAQDEAPAETSAVGDIEPPDEAEIAAPEPPPELPKTREEIKRVLESLVFVSDAVITAQQLGRAIKMKAPEVRELLAEITQEYQGRGIELVEVASGYQFRSAASSAPFVRDLVAQRPVRLTRAQLETLALVAYRQPITRPEIDDVRGVDSGSALKVLLERGLLKILGRKDEPGRPLLYGSAPYFLEFFGMRSMQDLPTLREFTDLTEENRELFKRKTGELPEDLSLEGAPIAGSAPSSEAIDDDELMAVAEAAKQAGMGETSPEVAEASADPDAQ
jgi:segregation and condensation protein B